MVTSYENKILAGLATGLVWIKCVIGYTDSGKGYQNEDLFFLMFWM